MKHKDNIIKLHKEGKSYSQIQDILGCSKGTISYHLGAGQKVKTADRQRKGRHKIDSFLREYKQSRGCTDCKENYPYWVLEFDHLSNKEFNVGKYRNHTKDLETVKKEVEKCEVVCANCHRSRTHKRSLKVGEYPETELFYQ